jgi:hypothetical protein
MVRFCPECAEDRLFEQYHGVPGDCPDTADGGCPEWGCTACGTALFVGLAADRIARAARAGVAELPGRVA